MWRTAVVAGQRLIHRCFGCAQRGYDRQSASTVVDRGAVVHRCPPAIHRMSTGVVPEPGDNSGTTAARPPQNLQQPIHTRPQDVDGEMTVGTCPHRFPQTLSTSVRSSPGACPPLGITPGYDRWTMLARRIRRPVADVSRKKATTTPRSRRSVGYVFCLMRLVSSAIWL